MSNDQHRKTLIKLITSISGRHGSWQVFSDFCEMSAIAISNAIDVNQADSRERRYLEVVKRYDVQKEVPLFPQMFSELVESLEVEMSDILGTVFHELELHNQWAGQFFTPYNLCRMMAEMTIGSREEFEAAIEHRGFLTALEPAAGSGAMVVAIADTLKSKGLNYQQKLHVTAVDVDIKCVHMAYLQLSLLHIPAVIVHGNSISLEEHSHWYTPAHIMGLWNLKLRTGRSALPDESWLVEAAERSDQRERMNTLKGEIGFSPSAAVASVPERAQINLAAAHEQLTLL